MNKVIGFLNNRYFVAAVVALFLLSRRAVGLNGQAQLVDAASLSAFPPLPPEALSAN